MESGGMFVELDDLRIEVDQVFRRAGYIRPSGANYMAQLTTRRFHHSTFNLDERKINMSSYVL